ncbi:MAG: hypothetical protein NC311_07640 [Muribaculaceae bacterium]|nr:hypothetical protein [Muribaculaceae bacterium]
MSTGNTFDNKTVSFGHARKVWREIRQMYPAGGRVANIADWVDKKLIPAGTLASWYENENGGKEVKCFTPEQAAEASGDNLGYTDRDIPVKDANTIATATVVYEGEIYKYMLPEAVAEAGKTLVPGVKQVF